MTTQLTLNIPDRLLRRAKALATVRKQEVAEAVTEFLDTHLPATEPERIDEFPRAEQVNALEKEKQAYLRMHPMLKKQYFGRFVAVHRGELIDSDDDFAILYERIHARLPNQIVWMSKVEEEPIKTVVMRSPRFANARK